MEPPEEGWGLIVLENLGTKPGERQYAAEKRFVDPQKKNSRRKGQSPEKKFLNVKLGG